MDSIIVFTFLTNMSPKADATLDEDNSLPFSNMVSGTLDTLTSLATLIASHRDLELPGKRLRRTLFALIDVKNVLISLLGVFRRLFFSGVLLVTVF